MARIACVCPIRANWPKGDWVHDAALDAGHQARHVRTIPELFDADRWADVVLFEQRAPCFPASAIVKAAKHRQAIWCQWWFDLFALNDGPLNEQHHWRAFSDILRSMDCVFLKERARLDEFQSLGVNAEWLDQGCPSNMPACEHQERPEWDVLVWGSSRGYPERVADVTALVQAGYRVAWAGHPGPKPKGVIALPFCEPMELPKLMSRAAVCLCVDYTHSVDGYWSDRLWIAAGMGAVVLRRNSPGLPVGPIVTYDSAAELCRWVKFLRRDHASRVELGKVTRRWVIREHCYEHRIGELVNHLCVRRENAIPAASSSL